MLIYVNYFAHTASSLQVGGSLPVFAGTALSRSLEACSILLGACPCFTPAEVCSFTPMRGQQSGSRDGGLSNSGVWGAEWKTEGSRTDVIDF